MRGGFMKELLKNLTAWSEGMNTHKMPKWESLPDIDLYMDQVITYMERQMNFLINDEEEKTITPSMINNYVKYKQIPSPIKKKYSKEHLGYLLTVCMLKQVLPINDISKLINSQREKMDMSEIYNSFCSVQDEAIQTVSERVREVASTVNESESEDVLSMLALRLAVEANASRIAAEKILDLLEQRKEKSLGDGKVK